MLEIRDKSASTPEARKQDISSWKEATLTRLNSKAKKRYSKNKSAIVAYFTGDKPIEEIAKRYNLSTGQLLKMVENSLKQHEDGSPWGYRALIPGVLVKDHSSSSAPEQPETQDTTINDAPSTPEPEKQEPTSADEENLEPTTKRLASITTPTDATEETPVEVVPAQPANSDETDTVDRLQNSHTESSPLPVSTTSEVVSSEDTIENTDTEIPEQSDETQAESPTISTSPNDTADTTLAASSPSDDTDSKAPASESEVPLDTPEASVTESRVIPHTPEIPTESAVTPDNPEVPEADADATTHEPTSPGPQNLPLEETVLAEPATIEEQNLEHASEPEDTPTPIEAQEPGTSLDEQAQATILEEKPDVESEITAVAIIDDIQVQLSQSARVTIPLVSEELTISSPINIYILPKSGQSSKHTTASHIAQRHRFVRKRWLRNAHSKTKRHRVYRTISVAMVVVILLSLLLPLGVGLAAYNAYNNLNTTAHDGINHLMTVKALLPTSKNDIMSALNAGKLQQAQGQLKAAETDFLQLQQLADRPDIQSIIQQVAPQYTGKLTMAKHLIQVALDVSRMGQELSGVGVVAADIVHSSPLAANSAKPLISMTDVSNIKAAITHSLYYMDDIQQNMSQVQLKDLPVSAKQKAQLSSVLAQLPSIRDLIVQNQNMVDLVTWLLGVGQPRRFLVQTMDTGELRPGGGFTGQYGILNVQNGRVAPFTLRDVALLDYAGNGTELGRQPPSQYSWMNFGNWGLRDSNLSGDYPTTARINMQVFQEEGGGPVDGVIDFTPTFIGHIIDVTGPIHVAEYNETITASNLADRLHYYQQNYNAIALEHQKSNDDSHQARKAFTSLLGKMLLQRVRGLPTNKLITIIKNAIKDIQSRDLEIYFTNPAAEQWLINNGYDGGMSTYSRQDGLMLVQANISISKASQYVHTTEQDNITLDAQGGATHNLSIALDYHQTGPVYGYDTYSDYMRLYVPRSSQFISGDGFDTGHASCAAPPSVPFPKDQPPMTVPPVSACNSLPPGETLNCPSGNYSLGTRSYNLPKTADVMGPPTATKSDLPDRGMFGGMTVTPKDCTSTIMLSWYVPHAVKHNGKQLVYPLLIQKQGGYIPGLQLNVDTSAIKGMKPFSFTGNLYADRLFNIL
ncbi:MAG: DUF4012 domain-containing protein [Ktedonobacteraceae bacterium]|nr:DUF4012 domain-containing protein [Ktedonobacteraceae bacterium]